MQHDLHLTYGDVTLRPLSADDAGAFRAIVDVDSWAGMSTPLPETDADMATHLDGLITADDILAFAVEQAGRFVGRTTFYDLVPGVRVEIGNTIYARDVWGTNVNPAAKLLLIGHAFDELGVQRVALRCDSRNERSHNAIRRLGAQFEGTLRNYRPAADGTIASVDYFSIVPSEWPNVREGLLARLG